MVSAVVCQLLRRERYRAPQYDGKERTEFGRIGQVTTLKPLAQLATKVKVTFSLDALRIVCYDQTDLDQVIGVSLS